MATTVTVQNTLNAITAFMGQRPMTGIGGNANEPALTMANYLYAFILQPPFRWSWNRTRVNSAITTVAGTPDYTVVAPVFGWLEKAVLVNPAAVAPTPPNFELEVYEVLADDGTQNRPLRIAKLLDDNAGNLTFRLMPPPDAIYTVDLLYQNFPGILTSLNNLWAPIPDKYIFLYTRGLLALLQMIYNHPLSATNWELFCRHLVAIAEGLDEEEKAIFLEDALRGQRFKNTEMMAGQIGKQARV